MGIAWFFIDDNIEIFPRRLKVVSLIVMDSDGSRSLRAANSLRYFTGRFTELSNSELPNSMVTGVTYRSLMNLISAAWAMWCSYMGGGVIGDVGVSSVGLVIMDGWGSFVVFSKLEGEVMIDVRAVRYYAYVDVWERSIIFRNFKVYVSRM